jgi:hypothetical protein
MSFADAAPVAVDVLFGCYGEAAVYTAAGGTAVPASVIRRREDPVIRGFVGPGVRSPGWSATLRQSEIPTRPREDDSLTIGGAAFVIRDVSEDGLRLFWRVSLNAA